MDIDQLVASPAVQKLLECWRRELVDLRNLVQTFWRQEEFRKMIVELHGDEREALLQIAHEETEKARLDL